MMKPRILRTYVRQLSAAGHSVAMLLEDSGITLDALEALEPLSRERVAEIIEVLAARVPDGAGIEAGRHTQVGDLGLVGYRQLFCRSFREVMEVWNRYSVLTSHPLGGNFAIEPDRWRFRYRPSLPLTPRALQFCLDEALSSLQTLLVTFFGADRPSVSVRLESPADEGLRRSYLAVGYCDVGFGAPYTGVAGDVAMLERTLICIDQEVRTLCESQCQGVLSLAMSEIGLAARVEHALRLLEPLPAAAELATRLGVSKRTLHRQLAGEGLSFQRILDGVRRDRAEVLLASGRFALKEVAWQLGYSDPSGLRRALRIWADATSPAPTSTSPATLNRPVAA